MDKIILLTGSVVGLLMLNLATISFLFFNNPNRNRPEPQKIIIEKLHFDQQQQEQYKQLIHWHRTQIDGLENKIKDTKNKLYQQLQKPETNLKTNDSLITALSEYQKEIENTHFKHFLSIKKLCKKEQLADFDNLTEELSKLFSKPPPPPKLN